MNILDRLKKFVTSRGICPAQITPTTEHLCHIIQELSEKVERLDVIVARHTRQIHDGKTAKDSA